jgi:hypothetical protein
VCRRRISFPIWRFISYYTTTSATNAPGQAWGVQEGDRYASYKRGTVASHRATCGRLAGSPQYQQRPVATIHHQGPDRVVLIKRHGKNLLPASMGSQARAHGHVWPHCIASPCTGAGAIDPRPLPQCVNVCSSIRSERCLSAAHVYALNPPIQFNRPVPWTEEVVNASMQSRGQTDQRTKQ